MSTDYLKPEPFDAYTLVEIAARLPQFKNPYSSRYKSLLPSTTKNVKEQTNCTADHFFVPKSQLPENEREHLNPLNCMPCRMAENVEKKTQSVVEWYSPYPRSRLKATIEFIRQMKALSEFLDSRVKGISTELYWQLNASKGKRKRFKAYLPELKRLSGKPELKTLN